MSIAGLADEEILRTERQNLDLTPVINRHLAPVIANLNLNPAAEAQLRAAVQPVAAASPVQKTPQSDTLDGLVKYIPTESITLYVAATAALPSVKESFHYVTDDRVYWAFVVLTPILFLLIYVGKRRSQHLSFLPESVWQWPWWKLIASTIAFIVWALAIPPLATTIGGKIAAAFGALFVSTLLSLIGAIVEPPPQQP